MNKFQTITIFYVIQFIDCKYTENILLERLFGGYRLDFVKTEKCRISSEHGAELVRHNKLDSIPDECVRYVKGMVFFQHIVQLPRLLQRGFV